MKKGIKQGVRAMGDRHAEVAALRIKLEQARQVIEHLVGDASVTGGEGKRAVEYFSSERLDPDFLPWPRPSPEGTRPEDLNAANDD